MVINESRILAKPALNSQKNQTTIDLPLHVGFTHDERKLRHDFAGFGAGKTTLLNHILTDMHLMTFAILKTSSAKWAGQCHSQTQSDEDIIEMNNGCICCTVRGDFHG